MNISANLIMSPNVKNKGHILIVDDKPDNLRLLSTILTERGYRVRKAINGQLALMGVKADPPDLVLLDITMPEMNGYEVCRRLKADDISHHIPVIFISALDEAWSKVEAFAIGGVDYVTKPFQWEEVLARVENQMKIRRLQQQLQDQNVLLQEQVHRRETALKEREAAELALQTANAALQEANTKLEQLANSDGLTQIANRRSFDQRLNQEWLRLAREQASLSLLLCDLDCFKAYNDTYGHQGGDWCLKQVTAAISRIAKRPADLVARYGGEEIAVILPNTDLEGALKIAEDIQGAVRSLEIIHSTSIVGSYVTVSIGAASQVPDRRFSPLTLLSGADRALYQAKAEGRDRVVSAGS